MASGEHDCKDGEFQSLEEAQTCEFIKPGIHSVVKSNMKEVDSFQKGDINKKRLPASRTTHSSARVKRVVSSKRKTRHGTATPGGRRRSSLAGRGCDLANKENEVTCAADLKGMLCSDHGRFPVNFTEATKVDGAGSKHSDCFKELSKDHDTMMQVLFGRNLRLNVALTLWRRNAGELIAFLIRIQDTGVLADCLPVITKSLQDDKPRVTIGCCVDLMPLLKNMLSSQYEEYLIVGLHWVQSVVKKWWSELSANNKSTPNSQPNDRNIQVMKEQLQELWKHGCHLSSVPGTTGDLAKVIESHLSQLH
ncbi:hypothetical protein GJAV_G00012640 [Gymnothorax javanicus]|nr:hypothetical protein GJAV_G00012640 [Gymnothorax javanicus]